MSEPVEITTSSGLKVPLNMSVSYISFSAHSDFLQTSEFIDNLKPPYIVNFFLKKYLFKFFFFFARFLFMEMLMRWED